MNYLRFKEQFIKARLQLIEALMLEVKSKIEMVRTSDPDYIDWSPDGLDITKGPLLVWEPLDDQFSVIVEGIKSDGQEVLLSDGNKISIDQVSIDMLISILEKVEAMTEPKLVNEFIIS